MLQQTSFSLLLMPIHSFVPFLLTSLRPTAWIPARSIHITLKKAASATGVSLGSHVLSVPVISCWLSPVAGVHFLHSALGESIAQWNGNIPTRGKAQWAQREWTVIYSLCRILRGLRTRIINRGVLAFEGSVPYCVIPVIPFTWGLCSLRLLSIHNVYFRWFGACLKSEKPASFTAAPSSQGDYLS